MDLSVEINIAFLRSQTVFIFMATLTLKIQKGGMLACKFHWQYDEGTGIGHDNGLGKIKRKLAYCRLEFLLPNSSLLHHFMLYASGVLTAQDY